jgi:hypothetical protein
MRVVKVKSTDQHGVPVLHRARMVTVAVANKTARIAWALMARDESSRVVRAA